MQNETYTFTVIAFDNGKPENFNSTATVILSIFSPDNHFNPVLNQSNYVVFVDENDEDGAPMEQVLLHFTVADEDEVGSPASEIGEAELIGVDAVYFTVELTGPNSGIIKTK